MHNEQEFKPFPKKILVTSCKGGVGKSTVSANLSLWLALLGKKVLLCDLDFGNRCLDLIMGLEDRVVYDICDAASGRVPAEKAILRDGRCERLRFVSAPYSYIKQLSQDALAAFLNRAATLYDLDYIIMDSPCGNDRMLDVAAASADSAFIVTMPHATALRSAEKTGYMLTRMKVGNQRLIINHFQTRGKRGKIKDDYRAIIELIDKTRIRLIGVIPESRRLVALQNEGRLTDEAECSNAAAAFENIACRVMGQNVRLMRNFRPKYDI